MMQGRRLRLGDSYHLGDIPPGAYWQGAGHLSTAIWYFRDPLGDLGSLANHKVTEHEDGTITVEPSILNVHGRGFHGWLKAGVWTEADDSGQVRPRPARNAFPGRK